MKVLVSALGFCLAAAAIAVPTAQPGAAGVGNSICTAAPNSFSATGAVITSAGSDSVAANDLSFDASGLPPNELGILLAGRVGPQAPFRDGWLCLDMGPGVLRLNKFLSDGSGQASVLLDHNVGTAGLLLPGQTRVFHILYRDCMSQASGINSTNGIEVTFTP